MVHDPKRNLLYIAAGDGVLRYQMASHSFLPPLPLGGDLRGIDLSLDHDTLVVADASRHGGNLSIHLVALETGARSIVGFPAEPQESGTFSVVFGADGSVWITSSMNGSGGDAPLRKYIPSTQHVTVLARTPPDTMLATSANREYVAYACANDPAGDFGWFRCRALRLPPPLQANARLFELGISRDGSQLALPNARGVTLSGASSPASKKPMSSASPTTPSRTLCSSPGAASPPLKSWRPPITPQPRSSNLAGPWPPLATMRLLPAACACPTTANSSSAPSRAASVMPS